MLFSSYKAGTATAGVSPAPLFVPSGSRRETHLSLAETRQEGSEAGRPPPPARRELLLGLRVNRFTAFMGI